MRVRLSLLCLFIGCSTTDPNELCGRFGLVPDFERDACRCPDGTVTRDDGNGCDLPDGGVVYFPDASLPDAGNDAGTELDGGPPDAGESIDGGSDAGGCECRDDDPCTIDACDAEGGCSHSPDRRCVTRVFAGGPGQVEVPGGYTCAVRLDGTTACWGSNLYGKVGTGEASTFERAPNDLPLPGLSELALGSYHACAIVSAGRLACWGRNDFGQSYGDESPRLDVVVQPGFASLRHVAVGTAHSCVVRPEGEVDCWGANRASQLGDLSTDDSSVVVRTMIADARQVALGDQNTCALRTDGSVACWGDGSFGELGHGTRTDSARPVVALLSGPARSITSGQNRVCALLESGRVSCWGNRTGGTPTATPVDIGVENVDELACKGFLCCARTGGRIACWGANREGQYGIGERSDGGMTPQNVSSIDDAISLGVGALHACAVRADHSLWCWGLNADAQLGDGTTESRMLPTRVTVLD